MSAPKTKSDYSKNQCSRGTFSLFLPAPSWAPLHRRQSRHLYRAQAKRKLFGGARWDPAVYPILPRVCQSHSTSAPGLRPLARRQNHQRLPARWNAVNGKRSGVSESQKVLYRLVFYFTAPLPPRPSVSCLSLYTILYTCTLCAPFHALSPFKCLRITSTDSTPSRIFTGTCLLLFLKAIIDLIKHLSRCSWLFLMEIFDGKAYSASALALTAILRQPTVTADPPRSCHPPVCMTLYQNCPTRHASSAADVPASSTAQPPARFRGRWVPSYSGC